MKTKTKSNLAKTPAAQGYRMPAEWEPHEATWLGWPHQATDWPGKMSAIRWVYGEIIRKLGTGETIRLCVNSAAKEKAARRIIQQSGGDPAQVEFLPFRTDRG